MIGGMFVVGNRHLIGNSPPAAVAPFFDAAIRVGTGSMAMGDEECEFSAGGTGRGGIGG